MSNICPHEEASCIASGQWVERHRLTFSADETLTLASIPTSGLCVAMPIFYATGKPWKAFLWATLSGLTEPFGECGVSPRVTCRGKLILPSWVCRVGSHGDSFC